MKKVFLIAPIALFTVLTSCEGETKTESAEVAEVAAVAEQVVSKDYVVNTLESTVEWQGEGVGHGHKGNLSVNAGKFKIENDKVVEGTVEIDMTSLTVTDIPVEEEENAKLVGHLTTEDFFNVAEFPTALLVITDGSDMNNIKANLTIKDVTEEITFALSSGRNVMVLLLNGIRSSVPIKLAIAFTKNSLFPKITDLSYLSKFTFLGMICTCPW